MNPTRSPHASLAAPCPRTADCSRCAVTLCAQSSRVQDAVRLIQLGARAGLVHQLTGLGKATANRLYLQWHQTPSPSGQRPFTDAWYRKDDRRMLQASLIWRLHRRLSRSSSHPARTLIQVFEAYLLLVPEPRLDLTRAEYVPRLVAMGTWQEQTCEYCGLSYPAPVENNGTACPGCRLYYRHRSPQYGTDLEGGSLK